VLGEGQDTVDVELIEDSVIQLDLSERELLAKLVPLALLSVSVGPGASRRPILKAISAAASLRPVYCLVRLMAGLRS
jgi:hypothetical protein